MLITQLMEKSAVKKKPTDTIYSEGCATVDTNFVFAAVQKERQKSNPGKQKRNKKDTKEKNLN